MARGLELTGASAGSVTPSANRGRFVTFEGGEGAGKSTQLEAIATAARTTGLEVVTAREPGGTDFGERIRAALLGSSEPPPPLAELLAFAAARAALVAEVIAPALERGALVLCDRFGDSTVAYQHFGRGLERALVESANGMATGGLVPDLSVLFDLAPEAGRERNGGESDYLEREDLTFHERVSAGFLALASEDAERWLILDATRPLEELTGAIWERVRALTSL